MDDSTQPREETLRSSHIMEICVVEKEHRIPWQFVEFGKDYKKEIAYRERSEESKLCRKSGQADSPSRESRNTSSGRIRNGKARRQSSMTGEPSQIGKHGSWTRRHSTVLDKRTVAFHWSHLVVVWMRHSPIVSSIWILSSQWWPGFWTFKRCVPSKRSMVLFKNLKIPTISSFLSGLHPCLRSDSSPSCSYHHRL